MKEQNNTTETNIKTPGETGRAPLESPQHTSDGLHGSDPRDHSSQTGTHEQLQKKHPTALPRNHQLRNYRILKLLGAGYFSYTYLAVDTNLPMLFIIREYLPAGIAKRGPGLILVPKSSEHAFKYNTGLSQFLNDAEIIARLQHDNIVPLHTFFEDHHTAYMVMPYRNGENLSAALKRNKKIPEGNLIKIVLGFLNGLEQLHFNGYIHRNIKLSSFFLPRTSSEMLAISGDTYQVLEQEGITSILLPSGDSPFAEFDTSQGLLGPWTDIYSIGAVLYMCVTGLIPSSITARTQAIKENTADPVSPAVDIGDRLYSETLLTAVDAAMSVRIKSRPQDIDTLRQLLLASPNSGQGDSSKAHPIPTRPSEQAPDPSTAGNDSSDGDTDEASQETSNLLETIKDGIGGLFGFFSSKKKDMEEFSSEADHLSKEIAGINSAEEIELVKKKFSIKLDLLKKQFKEVSNHLEHNERSLQTAMKELRRLEIGRKPRPKQEDSTPQRPEEQPPPAQMPVRATGTDSYFKNKMAGQSTSSRSESADDEQKSSGHPLDARRTPHIEHPVHDPIGPVHAPQPLFHSHPQTIPSERDPVYKAEKLPPFAKLVALDKNMVPEVQDITLELAELSIGSGPGNTISIDTRKLSTKNARIYPMDGIWHIEEFPGSLGVKVNDIKIQNSPLKEDDIIYIGYIPYKYQSHGLSHATQQNALMDEISEKYSKNSDGFVIIKLQIFNIDRVAKEFNKKEAERVEQSIETRLKKHFIGSNDIIYKSISGKYFIIYHDADRDAIAPVFSKLVEKIKTKVVPAGVGSKPIFVEGKFATINSEDYQHADEMIEALGLLQETIGLPLV
ncbi:MAG: protein kinase [Magnetococcales bacterium]|nr:protein kinase [Magnetococcales bacterium]